MDSDAQASPDHEQVLEKLYGTFISAGFKTKSLFTDELFGGWGLLSKHATPWQDEAGNGAFLEAAEDIKKFSFSDKNNYTSENIDVLRWRHWIIAFSVRYAANFCPNPEFRLVECGVGFGWSAFFAMRELRSLQEQGVIQGFSSHLYDAFVGNAKYGNNLSHEVTSSNLADFKDNTTWHVGYVPETLHQDPPGPGHVSYLHIDLNVVEPSVAALDNFMPIFDQRAVILFDDYGHEAHKRLLATLNDYFRDKPGVLMPLPTGQALYFT